MLCKLVPIIEEAGALALSHFRNLAPSEVAEKNHLDLVTVADRAVESLLVKQLQAIFPGDGIFGEEGSRYSSQTGRTWVIDPIDGTFNFVRGRDDWAISVGLHEAGQPVLGAVLQPARRRLLTGGVATPPAIDGRPLKPLSAYAPALSAAQIGNGGAAPLADVPETVRLLSQAGKTMVRMTNASTAAMIELITGEVDGYVTCGDSSWDLMGTWPSAIALGAVSTLDWSELSLEDRRLCIIGKPAFVQRCQEIGVFRDTGI